MQTDTLNKQYMNYQEPEQSKKLMELNAYYIDNYASKDPSFKALIKFRLDNAITYLKKLIKNKDNSLKKILIKIITRIYPSISIDHLNIPQPSANTEINYISKNKNKSAKVAVYTSIFGESDIIHEPLYKSDKCDYYAITDQNLSTDSFWKKLDCSGIPGFSEYDGYHKSKFCKLFPHILFPEYDYSIWVDGNAQIVADLYPLIDQLDDSHVMGSFENPLHDCIYTEKNYIIYIDAANTKAIENQIKTYKKAGFPPKYGMREFSILMRRHSDKKLQDLMNQWWEHCNKYTMRDQISFPFILWKNGLDIDYIQKYSGNWRKNPRFLFISHKRFNNS